MNRLRVNEDIHSLSDFRSSMASFVKQINETNRPMVLTQHGRGVAVLIGVDEYQRLQERLELLEDVQQAQAQIEAGAGILHSDAKAMILKGLRN